MSPPVPCRNRAVVVVADPLRTVQRMMGSTGRPMVVVHAEDSSPVADGDGTATTDTVRDGTDGTQLLLLLPLLHQEHSRRECTLAACRTLTRVGRPQRTGRQFPLSSHFPDDGRRIRWRLYCYCPTVLLLLTMRRQQRPCW